MVFIFKNQKLTIDQLKSGKITENIYSDTELRVLKVAKAWLSGGDFLKVHTSGSTGSPKNIELPWKVLNYSAEQTMRSLDPAGRFQSSLLCINPDYIGGIMAIVRALIRGLDLTVVDPSGDPSRESEHAYDLVSMVPVQVQNILDQYPQRLNHYRNVLIGGAPLPDRYADMLRNLSGTTCYHTYGMTETASHFALRNLSLGESSYQTLGDAEIRQDDRGCLMVRGTVTGHSWLSTNDLVDLISPAGFIFKGRIDHVINSGGVKIHPEKVEERLSGQIRSSFMICGRPDERLGERVTLLLEGKDKKLVLDFDQLDPYEKPREIIYLPKFVYTETGKINRAETIKTLD